VSNDDERLRARLPAVGGYAHSALRLAAVLCPIVARAGQDCLLFVVRPAGLREHPGQVAFPGGKRDGRETPLQTALRECREEIGAPADAIRPLGALPPRASSSRMLVHCIVARLAPVELATDAREVARVLHVPLAELRREELWRDRPPPPGASGRKPRTSPHFCAGDDLLWGLTARFVRDLIPLLPA
jgi:8-oxo-dGTP pyrophosphatase MutT (NUDIX family)